MGRRERGWVGGWEGEKVGGRKTGWLVGREGGWEGERVAGRDGEDGKERGYEGGRGIPYISFSLLWSLAGIAAGGLQFDVFLGSSQAG